MEFTTAAIYRHSSNSSRSWAHITHNRPKIFAMHCWITQSSKTNAYDKAVMRLLLTTRRCSLSSDTEKLEIGAMNRHRQNRREFLGLVGAGVAGLASGSFLSANASAEENADFDPRHADLVVFNAKVYTVDSRMPTAEAFAVKGSRFVFVGNTAAARTFIGKRTQTMDVKQMTVVPGFIDCHNHAEGDVLLYETLVGNPFEVEFVTIDSIIEKLRAKAQKTPPGFWVEGHFFDDTKVKDNRRLTVHDLDQVSHEHPVGVHHRGGHSSYYNSK